MICNESGFREMEDHRLIACAMQQDEIEKIKKKHHIFIPTVYLPRGMHKNPKELHELLQQEINKYQTHDAILLSYGLCGCATEGLVSANTKLVLPRFHDCIRQLMENQVETYSLYLTRAWTLDEESVLGQCNRIYEEYGREMGEDILRTIYGGYRDITVIDTHSYDMEPVLAHAKETAARLKMTVSIADSKVSVIEKLLKKNWDENILVLQPGEKITRNMFSFISK